MENINLEDFNKEPDNKKPEISVTPETTENLVKKILKDPFLQELDEKIKEIEKSNMPKSEKDEFLTDLHRLYSSILRYKFELERGEFKDYSGHQIVRLDSEGNFLDYGIRKEREDEWISLSHKSTTGIGLIPADISTAQEHQRYTKEQLRILESPLQKKLMKLLEKIGGSWKARMLFNKHNFKEKGDKGISEYDYASYFLTRNSERLKIVEQIIDEELKNLESPENKEK